MRISDWSSDVCSSDLLNWAEFGPPPRRLISLQIETDLLPETFIPAIAAIPLELPFKSSRNGAGPSVGFERSEEHTSELQSQMRISYAVFCLNKKTQKVPNDTTHIQTRRRS